MLGVSGLNLIIIILKNCKCHISTMKCNSNDHWWQKYNQISEISGFKYLYHNKCSFPQQQYKNKTVGGLRMAERVNMGNFGGQAFNKTNFCDFPYIKYEH